ncbi:hypothetical protein ABIE38_003150, partial [Dietzia sp. 2505]
AARFCANVADRATSLNASAPNVSRGSGTARSAPNAAELVVVIIGPTAPPRANQTVPSFERVIYCISSPEIVQEFEYKPRAGCPDHPTITRQRRPSTEGETPLVAPTLSGRRESDQAEASIQAEAPLDLPADLRSLHASTTRSDIACSAFLRYERGS